MESRLSWKTPIRDVRSRFDFNSDPVNLQFGLKIMSHVLYHIFVKKVLLVSFENFNPLIVKTTKIPQLRYRIESVSHSGYDKKDWHSRIVSHKLCNLRQVELPRH